MRVAISSRIFAPEPSAASIRLEALAKALAEDGHDVEVLTVRPGRQYFGHLDSVGAPAYRVRVKRFPVLRDKTGYVRGYLPYLSFDIPLFFRILFGRRRDLVVTEPPPTTGFFVRIATAIRRMPYAYYAADVWADASAQTGAPRWMLRAVARIEQFAWRGALPVLSVSNGVTARLRELGHSGNVVEIGNGIDVSKLQRALHEDQAVGDDDFGRTPAFVYAGTASEWHGAGIFVEALALMDSEVPLYFIGGGSEREKLELRAKTLGLTERVRFFDTRQAEQLAPVLAQSVAALASLKPGAGYDFAFPTKLYTAVACGAPVVHAGGGPGEDFALTEVEGLTLGEAVPMQAEQVAAAMDRAARAYLQHGPDEVRRERVRAWALQHISIAAVAKRATRALVDVGAYRGQRAS